MNISQTEARRLKRRVDELERMEKMRRARYSAQYPGGVNIATQNFGFDTDFMPTAVRTARACGHAVVVVADGNVLRYYAIPHPEQPA